jgi:hypothetical protein
MTAPASPVDPRPDVALDGLVEYRVDPVGPMARLQRVPVRWLRGEAEAGRVPCLKADRAILFDPDAVEQVLLERARQGQEARQ